MRADPATRAGAKDEKMKETMEFKEGVGTVLTLYLDWYKVVEIGKGWSVVESTYYANEYHNHIAGGFVVNELPWTPYNIVPLEPGLYATQEDAANIAVTLDRQADARRDQAFAKLDMANIAQMCQVGGMKVKVL